MAKYYVYSASVDSRRQKHGHSRACHKCGIPLKLGDNCVSIHSHTNSRPRHTKIYHQKCYENLSTYRSGMDMLIIQGDRTKSSA